MRPLAVFLALTLVASASASEAPSNQTLVFYNARLALREGRPEDVLKLWLLRNSLSQRGERGPKDGEFRSVVWAALGELGLCQDGFPKDDRGGAGLWPLALHNWLLQGMARRARSPPLSPFDAFDVGRQQRLVSLHDVLSVEELRSVRFFESGCLLPFLTSLELSPERWLDIKNPLSVGLLLRELLKASRATLAPKKVQSLAAVEARLFDLELALLDLEERRARGEGLAAARRARSLGVFESGATELQRATEARPENTRHAPFLRQSLTWTPEDWLALSRERRLFLFSRARLLSTDEAALETRALAVLDALIDQEEGDEVASWIGLLDAGGAPRLRQALTAGSRGLRLLELGPPTGFRERPVIALHRGIGFLEAGQPHEALRSFAYALRHADESREASTAAALARRWLSYVLSRYETSEEVVAMLKALVPVQEYHLILEDLVWRAALRADRASFERLARSARAGGGLDARLARLRPLAEGRLGELMRQLGGAMQAEPHTALRFMRQLLERLETEEAGVRRAQVPTLKGVLGLLHLLAQGEGGSATQGRAAEELTARTRALLEGLSHLEPSAAGRAGAMSPRHEAFAGSIRLAPADALPWPFPAPQVAAPSALTPLSLKPVEWRDATGALVFGWRISE